MPRVIHLATILALLAGLVGAPLPRAVAADYPYDGMVEMDTPHRFDELLERLVQAVKDHGMFVVSQASASRFAASRDIDIPGNAIVDVFRNDFAVRMLEASVPAGFEAPLRLYVTESADGTARLTYRRPSAVFAPYGGPGLDAMAAELDVVFDGIARQAAAP